ncbi:MAG: hypothetical protein PHW13_02675 [Methylococcales bacterium]|nr:hypothetical protein [Methylococcales bacterium]
MPAYLLLCKNVVNGKVEWLERYKTLLRRSTGKAMSLAVLMFLLCPVKKALLCCLIVTNGNLEKSTFNKALLSGAEGLLANVTL